MEIRVVVGPSGAGKRTRLAILQDFFGFLTVTGVHPTRLRKVVEGMAAIQGNDLRLAIEIPTVPFSAEGFGAEYENFVEQCVHSFADLRRHLRQCDFAIVFMYCAQKDLAQRLTLGFHPLMASSGDLREAIFRECVTHVQLFSRLCDEFQAHRLPEREFVFSDRSAKSAEELREEISRRRYLKHPDERQQDARRAGDAASQDEDNTKRMIEAINKRLTEDPKAESAGGSSDNRQQSTFVTRGWNSMRTAVLQIYKAGQAMVSDTEGTLNCLILGESGTGKEAVAQFLHRCRDVKGEFVAIDCTALPEQLLESELFGCTKGAFTEAVDRKGLVSAAAEGTVFLDEVGLMPLPLQAKLLRFIETRRFRRLGSNEEERVENCRVIAATSRNLDDAIGEGRFLRDLHNRLSAISITIPSLRERREDILPLLKAYAPNVTFTPEAQALLFDYDWDGNVRELRRLAERYGKGSAPSVGLSEMLEDYPHSVAKGYMEGAVKWGWANRERAEQNRMRVYFEVLLDRQQRGIAGDDLKAAESRVTRRATAAPSRLFKTDEEVFAAQAVERARSGEVTDADLEFYRHMMRRRMQGGLARQDFEKEQEATARDVYERCGKNDAEAARWLGMSRSTFVDLRHRLGIS
jgi:DNA-binding NtrC family response regulator